MVRQTYSKALETVMNEADSKPVNVVRTRAEIMEGIISIGQQLLGPLPKVERIILCGERRELRSELRALETA